MSISQFSRRLAAPVVLVSYLLAATVSGMFHHHAGDCCHEGACAAGQPAESGRTGKRQGGCPHGHAHHRSKASGCSTQHVGHRSGQGSERPRPQRGPLRHPDCAACQFLAQFSLVTPHLTLELTATVAPHVSDAVDTSLPAIVADAHPARGPPCGA